MTDHAKKIRELADRIAEHARYRALRKRGTLQHLPPQGSLDDSRHKIQEACDRLEQALDPIRRTHEQD